MRARMGRSGFWLRYQNKLLLSLSCRLHPGARQCKLSADDHGDGPQKAIVVVDVVVTASV